MKFLAILEDSFREAIDTKVFTVQVGLAIMMTLLVASASFEPESPHEAMSNLVMALNSNAEVMSVALRPKPGMDAIAQHRLPFTLANATPLNGAPESPDSPYQITVGLYVGDPAEAARIRAAPVPLRDRLHEHFGKIGGTRVYEVTDVQLAGAGPKHVPQPNDPATVFFDVTVQPTPAVRLMWPHQVSLFFGALPMHQHNPPPLGMQLFAIENYLFNTIAAWIFILLGVVITSFFVPNMLRKGAVDLLLVRPLHRVRLLVYKYLGGVLFMFVNFTVLVTAVWVVLGLRTGIWKPGFLLSIPALTFFFAILYAVSALYGVLTRSAIVAILLTCAIWFGLFLVGTFYTLFNEKDLAREYPAWVKPTIDTLHAVLPRTKDLDVLMTRVLSRELLNEQEIHQQKLDELPSITWGESLTVSGAFVGVLLGIGSWRFFRKDY